MRLLPVVPLVLPLVVAGPLFAQGEEQLRDAFEGRTVIVKLDMPATSKGVNIRPTERRSLDTQELAERLKDYGTALKSGTSIMVTKVKVKKDLIEVQLGGGGYGTFGDDQGDVYVGSASKSTREKNLERDLKNEKDAAKRKAMQEELDRLRKDRASQDALLQATSATAEAANKARIREKALQAGSRFNIRYPGNVPADALTPDGVRAALAEYVDFGTATVAAPPAAPTHPLTLRKGLTQAETESLLGKPTRVTPRMEGTLRVVSAKYAQGDNEVTAEFVEGILIRYSISSR